jgi:hypothetical protein
MEFGNSTAVKTKLEDLEFGNSTSNSKTWSLETPRPDYKKLNVNVA